MAEIWYPRSWPDAVGEALTGRTGPRWSMAGAAPAAILARIRPITGSDTATARQLGVSTRTLRYWRTGERHPSPEHRSSLGRLLRRAQLSPARERRIRRGLYLVVDAQTVDSDDYRERRFMISQSPTDAPTPDTYNAMIDAWLAGDDDEVLALGIEIIREEYELPKPPLIVAVRRVYMAGTAGSFTSGILAARRRVQGDMADDM